MTVGTSPFHGGNRGSNPRRDAIYLLSQKFTSIHSTFILSARIRYTRTFIFKFWLTYVEENFTGFTDSFSISDLFVYCIERWSQKIFNHSNTSIWDGTQSTSNTRPLSQVINWWIPRFITWINRFIPCPSCNFFYDIILPNHLNHWSSNLPSSALHVLIKNINPKGDKPAQDDLRNIHLALILTW